MIGYIDSELYTVLKQQYKNNVKKSIKIDLYQPGEYIEIDKIQNVLLEMEDHFYPDKTLCYSTKFLKEIISKQNLNSNKFRLFAMDMIWCRKDYLFEYLFDYLENQNQNEPMKF